jgi:hypothetical protein
MHSTKYRELVLLLILLDEVESRSRELAERFPELGPVAEATSDAVGFCDLAVALEDIALARSFGRQDLDPSL